VQGRDVDLKPAQKVINTNPDLLHMPGVLGVWAGARASQPYVMLAVNQEGSSGQRVSPEWSWILIGTLGGGGRDCESVQVSQNVSSSKTITYRMVSLLGGGLEPPRLTAYAPQTYVSAISPPERCRGTELVSRTIFLASVSSGRGRRGQELQEFRRVFGRLVAERAT
jgi:hypothetical protein